MRDVLNVDLSDILEQDIENRVFARMCQILGAHKNKLGIYFKSMDSARETVDTFDYSKLPESVVERAKTVNTIEVATRKTITTQDDFLKGEVNSDLCKGLSIRFLEDEENSRIIISLHKEDSIES